MHLCHPMTVTAPRESQLSRLGALTATGYRPRGEVQQAKHEGYKCLCDGCGGFSKMLSHTKKDIQFLSGYTTLESISMEENPLHANPRDGCASTNAVQCAFRQSHGI